MRADTRIFVYICVCVCACDVNVMVAGSFPKVSIWHYIREDVDLEFHFLTLSFMCLYR